jgi:hypothetical protein
MGSSVGPMYLILVYHYIILFAAQTASDTSFPMLKLRFVV